MKSVTFSRFWWDTRPGAVTIILQIRSFFFIFHFFSFDFLTTKILNWWLGILDWVILPHWLPHLLIIVGFRGREKGRKSLLFDIFRYTRPQGKYIFKPEGHTLSEKAVGKNAKLESSWGNWKEWSWKVCGEVGKLELKLESSAWSWKVQMKLESDQWSWKV